MTGAGKTHTMLGDLYKISNSEPGICVLSIDSLFAKIKENKDISYKVKVSYLEIYNEQVKDLLSNDSPLKIQQNIGLNIIEDPIKGVTVPDLTEYVVNNSKELMQLMLKGNEKRTMAATSINQFSSRSHAILQISLEWCSENNGKTMVSNSKLCLVDLAGSERAATTENKGIRMIEGGKINRSLLALGNCINILSDKSKANISFVPYRDSKLTRLLKDSLGGNTKTVMIACVSPAASCYEETINTLKYAERAKKIKKKITKNIKEIEYEPSKYREIIENLQKEILGLKEQLTGQGKTDFGSGVINLGGSKYGATINLQQQINNINVESIGVQHEKNSTVLIGSNCEPEIPRKSTHSPQKLKNSEIGALNSVLVSKEIQDLDQEILKARQMKLQFESELLKNEENVRQSLKFTESIQMDDDTYLNKLSQELMAKYEEHYEMKESIQELNELKFQNDQLMKKLTSELENLQKIKKDGSSLGQNIKLIDQKIEHKMQEISELTKTIQNNEEIRSELERALDENNNIQQKYLGLVIKLQSHRKKDILELQIAVRSAKLEKMDIMMQNLEMRKKQRIFELEKEVQDKDFSQAKLEISELKEKLKQKDMILQAQKTQIEKQKQEISELMKYKELYNKMNFKTDLIDTPEKNIIEKPSPTLHKENNRYTRKEYEENNEEIKNTSFHSISNISMNFNDISNSDLEVMDNCVDALSKNKTQKMPKTKPQKRIKLTENTDNLEFLKTTRNPEIQSLTNKKRSSIAVKSTNMNIQNNIHNFLTRRNTQVIENPQNQRSSSNQSKKLNAKTELANTKNIHINLKHHENKTVNAKSFKEIGFFSSVNENYSRTLNHLINPNKNSQIQKSYHERRNSQKLFEIRSNSLIPHPETPPKLIKMQTQKIIPQEIINPEIRNDSPILTDEKYENLQNLIHSHNDKDINKLTYEIDELIRKQKESLKIDYDNLKDSPIKIITDDSQNNKNSSK